MKYLSRNSLIALGIVIPLWLRQLRFERSLATRQAEYEKALTGALGDYGRHIGRWQKDLVKQINRAFSPGGRRS